MRMMTSMAIIIMMKRTTKKYDEHYDKNDDDGTLWNLSNLNEGKVVCSSSSMSLVFPCQQSIVER